MKTLAYYEEPPDSMTGDQLRDEFVQVLAADPQSQAASISEALFALSEQQWNTYELADEQLRADVATTILKLWDDQDADRAETQKDWSLYSVNIRKAVEDAINEFGDTVDDPYSGMRS